MQHNLERPGFIYGTWQHISLNDKQISQAKTASKATTVLLLSKGEEVLTVLENGQLNLRDLLN